MTLTTDQLKYVLNVVGYFTWMTLTTNQLKCVLNVVGYFTWMTLTTNQLKYVLNIVGYFTWMTLTTNQSKMCTECGRKNRQVGYNYSTKVCIVYFILVITPSPVLQCLVYHVLTKLV